MKMKIDRLLAITTILMQTGTITAKKLAERFDVSTRTIYRDVEALSAAGIPIYTNKGAGGGIALLENYSLNRTLITEGESESLLLALNTFQATQFPDSGAVLEKVRSLFKNQPAIDWVEIDFFHWGASPNENNKFNDIKKAMLEQRVIAFDYVNADGRRSHRLAEPAKLIFKSNAWYLVAFCRRRQSHRIFRISRVKNVAVTAERFEKKTLAPLEKEEMQDYSKPLIQLKLQFQDKVLNRLYDDFDESFIARNPDGSYCVQVTMPEDEWVYGYILSFGCFVEVLEPAHIRDIIAERMRQGLKIYQK